AHYTLVAAGGGCIRVGGVKASALALEATKKRRPRHRLQGVDQDDRDLRLLQEVVLLLEYTGIIVIEADDHAGGDEHIVGLDFVHGAHQVQLLVLHLLGLSQARLAGRLDAEEDREEVGVAKQSEQLFVSN